MKNRLLLLLLSSFVLIFWSCKKEENRLIFQGGTAPVLAATTAGPLVLTGGNTANNEAIKFSWTNPNYKFNTGISSQDVNYMLQVDVAGNNFAGPDRQDIAIPRDLGIRYTVKELNQILTKLNLAENVPHNVEFRIKSTLANNTVPLYSNVIPMTITPYLDVAVPIPPSGQLYITGSAVASSWTNSPPAAQRFTQISNTLYEITVPLTAGAEYKFLSTLGQWQPQYGGSSATGGDLGFNMGLPGQSDPPAIPSPSVAGNYKITVNFKTGKYTVVQQ